MPWENALPTSRKSFTGRTDNMIGLPPVFDSGQVRQLNAGLDEKMLKLLHPGEDAKEIREWHESSRFLYDICMNETILEKLC